MLRIIFWLAFLGTGLYYELAAAVISVLLFLCLIRHKKLAIRVNVSSVAIFAISLFYALSATWAVDGGIAVWGAVKHLPAVLFALCLMQEKREERLRLLKDIPWLGAAMVTVSFALQFVPLLGDYFNISGRLGGFFQYPNTFACFLLLGLIVLLAEELPTDNRYLRTVCSIILSFGLLESESRAVMIIAIPMLLILLLIRKSLKITLWTAAEILCAVGLSFGASMLMGVDSGEHLADLSLHTSTFLGRILYWKDAIPQILKHPFGSGYLGYYFTQGSFQTGVYSVRWVHNDLLQILLDIGWIPAVLSVLAAVKAVFSRRICTMQRMVLLALLAHCLFDFDLQFAAMYFVIILCLDWECGKEYTVSLRKIPVIITAILFSVASLWIGLTSALTYSGNHAAAAQIYPANTLSNINLLTQITEADTLERAAERILKQNESVALAWNAKALAAYSRGDFGTMIQCKQQAISLSRYTLDEYIDYFSRLQVGVMLYQQAGDAASAAICEKEILSIQKTLDRVLAQTDPLAWQIADQPQLTMPKEYTDYVRTLQS